MGIRALNRHDTSLAAGLIAGTIVIFQQPLRFLLDVAGEVQDRYRLDLIPALVVLSVVFMFHQYRKRQQSRTEALAAATEARLERARVQELEQLVAFGRSLANALDFAALEQALWRQLPEFVRECQIWLIVRDSAQWRVAIEDSGERPPAGTLEHVAATAVAHAETRQSDALNGITIDGFLCFPVLVGHAPLGVVIIRDERHAIHEGQRRALAAALTFMGIAIRNVQLLIQTRENSLRDGLTRWFNRVHGVETLTAELRRSKRTGSPLSILMFDIDSFKTLNDRHGHLFGDAALVAVTKQIDNLLRGTDVKIRYGGDEFMVILPETPRAGAELVAEQMRRAVANIPMTTGTEVVSISTSIGVGVVDPGEMDAETIIERADTALYRAKRKGRNRVEVEEAPTEHRLTLVRAAGGR